MVDGDVDVLCILIFVIVLYGGWLSMVVSCLC